MRFSLRTAGSAVRTWLLSDRVARGSPRWNARSLVPGEPSASRTRLHAEWKKVVGVGETKNLDHVIKVAGDHPSLKAALAAVAPMDDGQTISNVRLARWLHEFNGVPVNGLKLSGGGIEAGSPLWTLQTCDQG